MSDFLNPGSKRTFGQAPETVPAEEQTPVEVVGDAEESASAGLTAMLAGANGTPTEPQESVDVSTEEVKEESEVQEDQGVSGDPEPRISGHAPFTKIQLETDDMSFAGKWRPSMMITSYIGNTVMLLEYLQNLERQHQLTMPIHACGIDPIVFEKTETVEGSDSLFMIGDEESQTVYELISVDGTLYMSCASECLNPEYLQSIVAEATASVKATGSYTFNMVGLRQLADSQGTDQLINTLRLNTYELSLLTDYMSQFEDMSISYVEIEGHQSIVFSTQY